MTYPDALSYLGQTRRFGMKLGLDTMRELAKSLGNPQDNLRFIHLAGTNGKGSTAAFFESCLRASGLRVGLYTSPHLVSVRERIQINRQPISEADLAEGMTVVSEIVGGRGNEEVTFFELMTALALWYFGREKVEWVVWETGLGGRLDATNIVTPVVCIITNIGLDHQQYLGESLRDIAAEKAGIIKPGVRVVTTEGPGEALDVIKARCAELGSALSTIRLHRYVADLGLRDGKQFMDFDGIEFELGLVGPHQVLNAACAIDMMWTMRSVEYARTRDKNYLIDDDAVERGLKETVWPGRFEILSENPLVVLDGAHNPAGTRMLVETWRAYLAARFGWSAREIEGRARLVFASVADKDISEMAELLRPLARKVSLVRLANERSAEPAQLAEAFSGLPCACYDSVSDLWHDMAAAPESITLITGSLFLVGEMLALRQGDTEEYRLNERLEILTATR
jgi:dihydrofolate synthase/folylpolyglutamate synthase